MFNHSTTLRLIFASDLPASDGYIVLVPHIHTEPRTRQLIFTKG